MDGEHEYALVAQDKHHNRRGLVQGGVLMTFADRACGMTARYVSGRPTLATVQLDVHFVEAGKIGEILIWRSRASSELTRSLIFMTTEVTAGKRCIAMASGVFKVLKNESDALHPSSFRDAPLGAGPESILTMGVMDRKSRVPRIEWGLGGRCGVMGGPRDRRNLAPRLVLIEGPDTRT